jgi:class 3 adenylate cyclase/tetratricopeptide (TPR) repeat protein
MGENLERWLDELGLGKYAEVFRENDVDFHALPHLTETDLRELGVSLGHRRILLAAIASLHHAPLSATPAKTTTVEMIRDEDAGAGTANALSRVTADAERRLLTVLFCDLVGSTALSQKLDPEEVRDLLSRYQDAAAGSVTRYGGHVAKYLGDGVLAYFGWPMAHEDQAERAVRAGLEAMAAVHSVTVAAHGPLEARVGIATGQVVVGDLIGTSGREYSAVAGHTPNLAHRLQEKAEPGQIIIAEATRRLIGETFVVEDLKAFNLKGIDQTVRAFRILRERQVDSRFEAIHGASLAPFIGRVHELGILLERWELARTDQGQAVFVSGEAGIGKSRLIQVLAEKAAEKPHQLLRLQCSPYHQNSAFYPVIERLSRAAGFAADDTAEQRLGKLETLLTQNQEDVPSVCAVYAELLSLDTPARYPKLELPPQKLKDLTLQTLVSRLTLMSKRMPVLVIIEDAHWIDPSTSELLERILARIPDLSAMVVITHRTEWSAPLAAGYSHATTIAISRLSRPQIRELVHAIIGCKPDIRLINDIAERTDGVPLFVEELTRMVLERGPDLPAIWDEIPATLQGSLMARLDGLSPAAKEVAQIASVIGREFGHDLLKQVTRLDDDPLNDALRDLTRARVIVTSGLSTSVYWFRHALIQDVAYQALLTSTRRECHKRIAEILAAKHPDVTETQPELIARHFSEADLPERALPLWEFAAERALARSANFEAVEHCGNALGLIEKLHDSELRSRESLRAQLLLGRALGNVGRMRESMHHLRLAADLARDQGEVSAFVTAALGFDDGRFLSNEPSRDSITLLEEALSLMGKDLRTRCQITSQLARAYLILGDSKASKKYSRLAAGQARRLDDRTSLFNLLVNNFLVPVSSQPEEHFRDWRAQIDELCRLADELDNDDARGRAFSIDVYVSAEFGDRARMDNALDRLSQLGEVRQRLLTQWIARHGRAVQAILDGDFAGAERHAESALALGRRTHGEEVEGVYGIQMFTIRREQARLAEVAPVIKHLVDEDSSQTTWKPGFALIACDLGYKAPAREILDELADRDFAFDRDAKRSMILAYLAEVCAAVEDQARAELLYELLLPFRSKTITVGITTVCYGAADRYLGLLASLLEKWQAAEEHFDAALEINEKMRARPWLAHAQYDFATMLRGRGRRDDPRRGDQLLKESLEAAMRLDMIALKQKIQGRLH